MVDMNYEDLEVPDTPDRMKQPTCHVSSSVAMSDIDPLPCRKYRYKISTNSMHDVTSQADVSSVLPIHTDADNIFRQADVARALAFPEDSEAKSNETIDTCLLNEKKAEKRALDLDQSSSISKHIKSSNAGERRQSFRIRDGEVSEKDANHRDTNSLGVIAGPSNPPSVVPQRHVGQKRLVRNGCISPSNVDKRSVKVDERQEMCSPSGILHHSRPQLDVYGTSNVIDLTDNSPTITRHGTSTVYISADNKDTRVAKRLRTYRAGKALIPPSEYHASGNNCSGVSLSGHNNKGKEISHDMLDSKRIGEANSRRVCLRSAGTSSVVNSSSSCVNPEQGWRTTNNHTSKLPIPSTGPGRESGSSAPFDLDHESAEGNSLTSGATTIRTERLGNRTIRIAAGRQKQALNSSYSGESTSALDESRASFRASSETTVGRYNTARRHVIPVINIDAVLPEAGPSSSGHDNGTSVDPTVQAQLEADELLARQLQEQLYNETSRAAPTEDIDAVIAMSLQREENSYRRSRAVRQPQYNTRGAQGSRSNVYQNAVARTNNMISHLQNTASITLGLGAVFPRYSGASHAQPNIDLNDYDSLLALDENNHQHTGASESQINSLPESVVQLNSIEEPCAVCLENPSVGDTIRHLPCFHKFHKECIDEWLRRKKLCPICKSGIR